MSPLALSLRFLQTQPDRRLLDLARAGHERAFEALVQRYRRQLLAYSRRMVGAEAAAEDVLQQALLQAWVAMGTADGEIRDARAWLYRIVHNAAVSHLRRPRPVAVDDSRPPVTLAAHDELERRLAAREALAAVAALPELQREVMLSTAIDGSSHDEVAAALGLSQGAVRGLIYRARAAVRAAAAAVIPAPVINWAARQELVEAGGHPAVLETVAGGASAGIGGLLIKGGALVVSVGALATAAGVGLEHHSHGHTKPVVGHPADPRAVAKLVRSASAPPAALAFLPGRVVPASTSGAGGSPGSRRAGEAPPTRSSGSATGGVVRSGSGRGQPGGGSDGGGSDHGSGTSDGTSGSPVATGTPSSSDGGRSPGGESSPASVSASRDGGSGSDGGPSVPSSGSGHGSGGGGSGSDGGSVPGGGSGDGTLVPPITLP